ncbi:hypothetical protein I3843_01G017000 [Carya illinoinensis]|nr:hypothetical protein I3843_01G017000 [Carya illinoinensis]
MAIINVHCMQVEPHREMTVEEFKAWLRGFDANHDERISREELKEVLASLRKWFAWWKARQGIKKADSNHDNQIDLRNMDEIEKLVNYCPTTFAHENQSRVNI